MWFVQRDGRLLVETDAASGKVKRIRRNPQVLVAVCNAGGRLRGEQVPAVAQILPGSEIGAVERLIADKYRFDMIIFRPLRFVQARLALDAGDGLVIWASWRLTNWLPGPRPRAEDTINQAVPAGRAISPGPTSIRQ